jgi:hypothetical protein
MFVWGRDLQVNGYVRFCLGSDPLATASPRPGYRAHFNDGHLQSIVRIEQGGGGPNLRFGVIPSVSGPELALRMKYQILPTD